jgi:hypothetical protein
MDEARAATLLLEREEELRVGARTLVRRLHGLKTHSVRLRAGLDAGHAVLDDLAALDEDIQAARWGLYELAADAIGTHYNAADVALWCDRAVEMGAARPRLDQALLLDLVHVRKVPNYPFRAALERRLKLPSGLLESESALRSRVALDTHRALKQIEEKRGGSFGSASLVHKGNGQSRILNRWLGVETSPAPSGTMPTLRLFVTYEQAEALARALDLTPQQAGI